MLHPDDNPRDHHDNQPLTPAARQRIGDTRWVCEQDNCLVTGWQLIEITGIPWQHFAQEGVRRIAKQGEEHSYVRVR